MSEKTGISWTDSTWNPWRGCAKVHARCKNCYMFSEQTRYGQDPSVVVRTKTWKEPLRWQKKAAAEGTKKMVFTCSWSDWFHADADLWRDEAWAVVKSCPNLIFQILTKRPLRIADHLPKDWGTGYENVWLGSSLDPQDAGGMALFDIPARVRFLSLEPLLGPVNIFGNSLRQGIGETGQSYGGSMALHWVIVGGESGSGARPCNVDWVRQVVQQCKSASVPCFVKQLGSNAIEVAKMQGDPLPLGWCRMTGFADKDYWKKSYHFKHPKGGDIQEFPTDLQVRQFPL